MRRNERIIPYVSFLTLLTVLLYTGGCALRPGQSESVLGSPEHHVLNGLKLMKKDRIDDARREFEFALEIDPEYSPAHRGLGLVYGVKRDFKPAFHSMRQAIYCAGKNDNKTLVHAGFIRLHTLKRDERLSVDPGKNVSLAKYFVNEVLDAYYHMGVAYKYGYRFSESREALEKVLKHGMSFMMETEEQIKIVKMIERAMPVSETGKSMAFLDHITRAHVSALFIRELELDQIYEKVRSMHYNTSLKAQGLPPDMENHAFRKDMEMVLKLDIHGLRIFQDGTFHPDELITRAGYAMMIADIIATIEKDPSLNIRYIKDISPFRDVRNDAPHFNAIMVCTTGTGIMEPKSGIFNPVGRISGAEALLIIRKIKDKLKEYGVE
ncbi:MAG: hypothetical protein SV375_01090 [Thermodesulfobacteriota bacterium]|nr:hypothetical protein [Thermodesulfobacteriota bacterium]